jgi:hypothetical protein
LANRIAGLTDADREALRRAAEILVRLAKQ